MTLDAKLRAELEQFAAALADGELSPADAQRLEAIVADNPAARDHFLLVQLLQAELELHYGVVDAHGLPELAEIESRQDMVEPASLGRRARAFVQRTYETLRRPTPFSMTVAALVVGVLLAGLALVAVPQYRRTAVVEEEPVFSARLTALRRVVWSDGQIGGAPGSRLVAGHRLQLQAGFAEVTFDSGARVVVAGPSDLRIASPNSAVLTHGRIVAHVPPEARGFTASTPTMEVVDLGTEFGLETDGRLQGTVSVFQGAVTLATKQGGVTSPARRIAKGETASVVNHRLQVSAQSQRPQRFERELPPSIIELVRSSTGRPYRVAAEGLREDAPAYTDELHEWNGIDASGLPAELRGAEFVQTANLDRTAPPYDVSVKISRPARLYVFWSKGVPPPAWLTRDFTDSGLFVGMDAIAGRGWPPTPGVGPGASVEIVHRVWQRDVAQPQTIHLGPTTQRDTAVFGIAVVPLTPLKE